MSKKLLFVVGSLRKESFNRQLANKVKEILGDKAKVSFLEYSDVPFFNQDIEYPAPSSVSRIRDEIKAADGIWFFTPEYNGSYSSVLKNIIDWASRSLDQTNPAGASAIGDKNVAVSGIGGSGYVQGVLEKTKELLKFIRTDVLDNSVGLAANPEAWATNVITFSDDQIKQLDKQVEDFLAFLV